MAEDAQIRRENLQRLVRARGWAPKDLEARAYGRYSYWRDLLHEPGKPFGEKAARKIEESLGLPRLWLDDAEASLELLTHGHAANEPQPLLPPGGWPFSSKLWAAVQRLDEDHVAQLERLMWVVLEK